MSEVYSDLERILVSEGIRCQFQKPGVFVISRQVGPIWPDRGNSFWVTHCAGHWHLFTWGPRGYRLEDTARIADLCRTFMAYSKRAEFAVADEIIQNFNPVCLSEEVAEAVCAAMPRE